MDKIIKIKLIILAKKEFDEELLSFYEFKVENLYSENTILKYIPKADTDLRIELTKKSGN